MDIIDLCKYNKSTKVLELLKNPDQCKLDQIDSDWCTALIHACD